MKALVIILTTNQTGNVVENTIYEPFGAVKSGGTAEDKLYEGKIVDNPNQYYFGSRYYDAQKQIFTQPDSIIPDVYDPQQLNIYTFEGNNPYSNVDPTGNIWDVLDFGFALYGLGQFILHPSWHTGVSFGLDIAFALAPVIPNINRIAEGASALNKAIDTGKSVSNSAKLVSYEKTLMETGEVTVNSFKEANALRESAFPGLTKVPGAGPKMTKASDSLFKGTSVYKTDYLVNPSTGKIYGHDLLSATHPHSTNPHINIKDQNGDKFTIIINKVRGIFG